MVRAISMNVLCVLDFRSYGMEPTPEVLRTFAFSKTWSYSNSSWDPANMIIQGSFNFDEDARNKQEF